MLMRTMSLSHLRQNMTAAMDSVADRDPLLVTRRGAEPVVVLSEDEYRRLTETDYLLSSPRNAERLRQSIQAANEGRLTVRELVQCD